MTDEGTLFSKAQLPHALLQAYHGNLQSISSRRSAPVTLTYPGTSWYHPQMVTSGPLRLALAAACLSASFSVAAAEEPPPPSEAPPPPVVTIAKVDWDSGRVVQHVLKEILETRFGVEVRFNPYDEDVEKAWHGLWTDIFPEFWMPGVTEYWRRFIAPGSLETFRVNSMPYYGQVGLHVPGYVQDEYGIFCVDDLADPDNAKLFDLDGDGLGELWPGIPQSNSIFIQQLKAEAYGYAPYFEMLDLAQGPFNKLFEEGYRAQRPLLFYAWEPSKLQAQFDLRKLKEPPFDGYAAPRWPADSLHVPESCWHFVSPNDDPEWHSKSSVSCADPPSEVWLGFRAGLFEELPAVAQFLENLAISNELVEAWIHLVYAYEFEPEEMARIWVEQNAEIVDQWVHGRPTLWMADLEWGSGRATTAVLKHILEERLDYPVGMVPDARSFAERVGRTGNLDIFADTWNPEALSYWTQFISSGSLETIRVGKPYYGREGFYVPASLEGVRHVDDLAKEDVKRLFDLDGDGRPEIWYGPPDWTSTYVFQVKARSYGIFDEYDSLDLPAGKIEERLKTAEAQGQGMLFYHWEPSAVAQRNSLRRLEEPPFDGYALPRRPDDPLFREGGCWKFLEPSSDAEWREKSEIRCASPESAVYVAYGSDLERRAPEAARFLSRVEFSREMVGEWVLRLADGEDPEEMARDWAQRNPRTVAAWLGEPDVESPDAVK